MPDVGLSPRAPDPERLSDDPLFPGIARDELGRPVLGGISLETKVGSGGMGAVYYGMHPRLGIPVAVKVLPYQLAATAPEAIARLTSEARAAARVQSAHLVRVFDVDSEAGLHYIVMEYVDGLSAKQYLALRGGSGIPESEALEIVRAAVRGLGDAHRAGVVHRDVKPDNILIPRGPDGRLDFAASKLTDLGIAKSAQAAGDVATGTGVALGTPGFMSPEQSLDARSAGPASDVFGMGATLYALLSGRPPFEGDSTLAVLMKTVSGRHEPVTRIRPGVTAATSAIVDRCLRKQPEGRFKRADEMLQPLTCALEGASVETDLWPSPSQRAALRRSAWRRVVVEAVVLVACVGLATGLAMHRAERRRDIRATAAEAGRLLIAGRPEDAAAALALVSARYPGNDEVVAGTGDLRRCAAREITRRAVAGRVQAFMVHLVRSELDACRSLVDPRFVEEHGQRASGVLGLSSLTLRVAGVTERDVRVAHVALGVADDAMARVEVRIGTQWRPVKSVRASLRKGSWFVWLEVPAVPGAPADGLSLRGAPGPTTR